MNTIEHISEPIAKAMEGATPGQQRGFLRFIMRFSDPDRPVSMYRASAEDAGIIVPFLVDMLGFRDGTDVKTEPSRGSVRIVWPDTTAIARLSACLAAACACDAESVSEFFTDGPDAYVGALHDATLNAAPTPTRPGFPDLAAASDKTMHVLIAECEAMAPEEMAKTIPDPDECRKVVAFCTNMRTRWGEPGRYATPLFPPMAVMEALLRVTGRITAAPRFSLLHCPEIVAYPSYPHMFARPVRRMETLPSMWLPVGTTLPSECLRGDKATSARRGRDHGLVGYVTETVEDYEAYMKNGNFAAALIIGDALLRQDPDTIRFVAQTEKFWDHVKLVILKWLEVGGVEGVALAMNRYSRIALNWSVPFVSTRSVDRAQGTSSDIIAETGLHQDTPPSGDTSGEYVDAASFASFAFLAVPATAYTKWKPRDSICKGVVVNTIVRTEDTPVAPTPALEVADLPVEWFAMVHGDFWKRRATRAGHLDQLRAIPEMSEADLLDKCSTASMSSSAGHDEMTVLCDGILPVFEDSAVETRYKTASCPGPLRDPRFAVTAVYSGMTSGQSALEWAGHDTPADFPPFSGEFDGGGVIYGGVPGRLGGTPLPPEEVTRRLRAIERNPEIMMHCNKRKGDSEFISRAAWIVLETNIDADCLCDVGPDRLKALKSKLIRLCTLTMLCGDTDPLAFATKTTFIDGSLGRRAAAIVKAAAPMADPDKLFGYQWSESISSLSGSTPNFGVTLSKDLDGRLVIAFSISCHKLNLSRIVFRDRVGLPPLSAWMRRKVKLADPDSGIVSDGPDKCIVPERISEHCLAVALLGHIVKTSSSYTDLSDPCYSWPATHNETASPCGGFTPLVAALRGESGRYQGYDVRSYSMAGQLMNPDCYMPEFF